MEREDKVIFFVYRGKVLERWFADLKEAVEFTILNGLVLERVHLKSNGSVHKMLLYQSNKNEAEYCRNSESPT
jgi:hypothetical protein